MVVHDLENPVSGIIMQLQLALRHPDELNPPQRHIMLQTQRTCEEFLR